MNEYQFLHLMSHANRDLKGINLGSLPKRQIPTSTSSQHNDQRTLSGLPMINQLLITYLWLKACDYEQSLRMQVG